MTDWRCRPESVFLGHLHFFGRVATAVVVAERSRFISHFLSFTKLTLRQINIGNVSYTVFYIIV